MLRNILSILKIKKIKIKYLKARFIYLGEYEFCPMFKVCCRYCSVLMQGISPSSFILATRTISLQHLNTGTSGSTSFEKKKCSRT